MRATEGPAPREDRPEAPDTTRRTKDVPMVARGPRTSQGRLVANYHRRVAAARAVVAGAERPYDRDRMTAEMFELDATYVSGALARLSDPEIRRLRAADRRARRTAA